MTRGRSCRVKKRRILIRISLTLFKQAEGEQRIYYEEFFSSSKKREWPRGASLFYCALRIMGLEKDNL